MVCGLNGPGQQRGMDDVRKKFVFLHQLTRTGCFLLAFSGESNINPTREKVLFVPFGLTVSQQN